MEESQKNECPVGVCAKKECPEKWKLDVNDRYRAAAAIVITLSSASFILPIFFLKDMAGIGTERTVWSELTGAAIWGWVCLGSSVLFGIIYHFLSAKWVKFAWSKTTDILRHRITNDELIEDSLDWSYLIMMVGFLTGIGLEVWFMINYKPTAPQSRTAGTQVTKPERMEFLRVPSLPDFAPASAALPAGVEEVACTVRRMVTNPGAVVAIVIGRHDQTELTLSAKRYFNSNATLAQQRAKAVESALRDLRRCDTSPILNVVALDSTPQHVGPNISPAELASDRRAEIYLFRQIP